MQSALPGRGCILADDMGLGKTLQTLAIIYTMIHKGRESNQRGVAVAEAINAAVICPTTLCLNWKKECLQWLPPVRQRTHHTRTSRVPTYLPTHNPHASDPRYLLVQQSPLTTSPCPLHCDVETDWPCVPSSSRCVRSW